MPDVVPLIARLYATKRCSAGGPLHIVTEDENLRDRDLRWIIDEGAWMAERHWPDDAAQLGVKIAEMMLQMTRTQRRKIVRRLYYGSGGENGPRIG